VLVRLTNQADLARRAGETFIPTSGFDPRSVGLAISRSSFDDSHGEPRHEVLIESGFSPEETVATLVHELAMSGNTTNSIMPSCTGIMATCCFEGHAVWAQAEFLKQASTTTIFDPGRFAQSN